MKIDVIIKVFCFGILPTIVSMPEGDINDISSPIFKLYAKLNSLPIDIELLINDDLFPLNLSLLIMSNFENSLFL